jgi:hypothetical protein
MGRDFITTRLDNDVVYAVDGMRDRVRCGRGQDTVYVDELDHAARSCENVVLS